MDVYNREAMISRITMNTVMNYCVVVKAPDIGWHSGGFHLAVTMLLLYSHYAD